MQLKGLLLVDKPEGWTSFDVVNYVRKMVAGIEGKKPRHIKCGHSGTLDPAATGLLVLAIGKEYTSQMPVLMKQDKVYVVELEIGKVSSTGDKEGDITAVSDTEPNEAEVEQAISQFVGEIEQTPPAYSAVKINGQRAYKLAREGKEVVIEPRKVMIHTIENITYTYPKITFSAHVGSGTYIRSLAADIGTKLGVGAYMSNLRRTTVGESEISQAYTVSSLTEELLIKVLASNR